MYPTLSNSDAVIAYPVVSSVKYNAAMTIYAILALLMAGLFLLGIYNRAPDSGTLLLCLYFLMLFLNEAYSNTTGYYSVLGSCEGLSILRWIYVAPLYLHLALRITKWWKWELCGAVVAWTLYEGVRRYLVIRQGYADLADMIGPEAMAVFLAVIAAFCAEQLQRGGRDRKRLLHYAMIAAAITALYVLNKARVWGGLSNYLHDGILVGLRMGDYWSLVSLSSDIVAYMTVIVVVSDVVRRTGQTLRTVSLLQERSRLTLEGYERMRKAQEATNAANHEMRHHMTALAGILRDGDTKRDGEYVASVTRALDRLPTARYSPNVLVNAIAGNYLDQAKAQGVRVECALAVPAELDIADEDLSVFLTNMLENALHACQKIDPDRERHIRVKMALHENFLFIGCVNSAPGGPGPAEQVPEKMEPRQHGYGLEAMRQIAEKYNSMLLLERKGGEFSVKSNFNLLSSAARR